jgi:hypothetical protein
MLASMQPRAVVARHTRSSVAPRVPLRIAATAARQAGAPQAAPLAHAARLAAAVACMWQHHTGRLMSSMAATAGDEVCLGARGCSPPPCLHLRLGAHHHAVCLVATIAMIAGCSRSTHWHAALSLCMSSGSAALCKHHRHQGVQQHPG